MQLPCKHYPATTDKFIADIEQAIFDLVEDPNLGEVKPIHSARYLMHRIPNHFLVHKIIDGDVYVVAIEGQVRNIKHRLAERQAYFDQQVIEGLSADSPAFVPCIVMCEINWVLKSAYKISKQERLGVLQNLLSVPVFDIEQLDSCMRALKYYKDGKADFSDYLIQDIGCVHGYDTLLTFDKNAKKSKGFKGL